MGSAVELVDLYSIVGVAGSAVPLQPAKEVELADLRPSFHTVSLRGCSIEHLLHARAKDAHHHLLEHTKEGPVMPTQHIFCSIPKCLHAFFFLL
jgi:hypothetical protein